MSRLDLAKVVMFPILHKLFRWIFSTGLLKMRLLTENVATTRVTGCSVCGGYH